MAAPTWQLPPTFDISEAFLTQVQTLTKGRGDRHLAQLLLQRDLGDESDLINFLDPDQYQPTSPFEFGQEMNNHHG